MANSKTYEESQDILERAYEAAIRSADVTVLDEVLVNATREQAFAYLDAYLALNAGN